MDPRIILQQLCRRHGLPPDLGLRLAPWLKIRLRGSRRHQRAVLDLVEAAIAREATARVRAKRAEEELEDRCLRAVAGVLHAWQRP